jgi:hypothetical protein
MLRTGTSVAENEMATASAAVDGCERAGTMEIADGLELLPGDDGTLPVRVRWVASADTPEAFAVDRDLVYVAGSELTAFNLSDGSTAWRYEDEDALEADGGVVIGFAGPQVVRVQAPWSYDFSVERRTGRRISTGEPPPPFSAAPARPPSEFRVGMGLGEIVGSWPDGTVAWRLLVESPFVDELAAVEASGAIVLVTSGQHVVVLDPVDA